MMKKKKVLFFVSPSFYFMTGYRQKSHAHNFMSSGALLLGSSLDPEKYEVALYEIDALLMRQFEPFEEHIDQCPELFDTNLLMDLLKGERENSWLQSVLDRLTAEFTGYDFILCTNNRNPTFEIPVRAGNHFTLLLYKALAEKNPKAEKIMGGLRSQYIAREEFSAQGVNLGDLVDLIVYNKIPFSSLQALLERREVVGSIFCDLSGKYTALPLPPGTAEPPLDYPRPLDIVRNQEDIKYSYDYIFSSLHLPKPDGEFKGKYIQQAELHYIGGCIGSCAFCSTAPAKLVKMNDQEPFIEKMKVLIYELGYNAFFFENATLNSNKPMVEKFCNWVVRENLKIFWSDSCRLSNNGPDFYKMLYAGGARMLCYGVDSGSDRILKYINKGSTAETMEQELGYAHDAGIWNLANFIGGHPFETAADLQLTIDFLERNLPKINIFKFNIFHLEHRSPFFISRQRFSLDIPNAAEIEGKREVETMALPEPIFHEIGGRTYQEFNEFRKYVRVQMKKTYDLRKRAFKTHIGQPLLFALYDILGSKTEVEKWLSENFRKGRKAYYEAYQGFKKIEKWETDYHLDTYFPQGKHKAIFPTIDLTQYGKGASVNEELVNSTHNSG